MSYRVPEIPGYQLDRRLLQHPLAELWHGRNFTGMEVVALVLSEYGARDDSVRERLVRASRVAALEPGQLETPLWAANLTAARPYAITQLIPGRTGAERLIDPLDGILGNDHETLQSVRTHLSQYGATPPAHQPWHSTPAAPPEDGTAIPSYTAHPTGDPVEGGAAEPRVGPAADPTGTAAQARTEAGATGAAARAGARPIGEATQTRTAARLPGAPTGGIGTASLAATATLAGIADQAAVDAARSKVAVAREYRHKIGGWIYLVVTVVVLIVFTVAYSVGAAVGSKVKHEGAPQAAPAKAVSPGAYPEPVLLPAIKRVTTAPYKHPDGSPGIAGAAWPAGADLQVIANAELPFAFGWPRPPQVDLLGESSALVLRRVVTKSEYSASGVKNSFTAQIALHPCVSLAQCLADRPAFDQQWTAIFKAPAPTTPKDTRTWLATGRLPYTITMTRAFESGGQWWLVGTAVSSARPGEEQDVQRIVNDIWRQTS